MRKPSTSDPSTHRTLTLSLAVSPQELARVEQVVSAAKARTGRAPARSAIVRQLILSGEHFLDA